MNRLRREHRLWLALLLLFLLAALQLSLWSGVGSRLELQRLQQGIERQQQENALLQARNEQIGLEVTSLKSGLEQIEVKAREELGLVRPNETLFLFVNEQTHAGQRPGPQPR
ncbi:MAG: septum formation initiator family protein [Pseudomonadales bacterium]|nr:septum formation initiator family protein [Pseudomonadales bacterium]MCC6530435.1 septum formation initiator family protein [Pseudomonadales bacterium]MCP5333284.1 septum formation initiator family protein [Pseudomonadales bacterium]HMU90490.1 septum formation initiator family protein [Pseudomonadales bacterium]HMW15400.1 septum formation initiator family protein [Pseudomonadales bacterium]